MVEKLITTMDNLDIFFVDLFEQTLGLPLQLFGWKNNIQFVYHHHKSMIFLRYLRYLYVLKIQANQMFNSSHALFLMRTIRSSSS